MTCCSVTAAESLSMLFIRTESARTVDVTQHFVVAQEGPTTP